MPPPPSPPKPEPIIRLNVGGEPFDTTSNTLTSPLSQHSMLSALATTSLPNRLDNTGRIFIDRDGPRFRILLNYLRQGTVHVVDGVVPCPGVMGGIALGELLEEARYFGLLQLERVVKEEIGRLELEESLISIGGGDRKVPHDEKDGRVSNVEDLKGGDSEGGSPVSVIMDNKPLTRGLEPYCFTLDADF